MAKLVMVRVDGGRVSLKLRVESLDLDPGDVLGTGLSIPARGADRTGTDECLSSHPTGPVSG